MFPRSLYNGEGLGTGVDEELGENGLELYVPGIEIVTCYEGLFTCGKRKGTLSEARVKSLKMRMLESH